MKIDLSQEYKDNLYEKVLEKKKQRTKTRKVLLNTFLVFVSVVGIASYGFSKLSKGDYNNFFISKTDNIEFNDEYEYFDDLGIKLEFINKDENSLTLGINIKYENIKDYEIIEELVLTDLKTGYEYKNNLKEKNEYIRDVRKDFSYKSKNECIYIIEYVFEKNNKSDEFLILFDNMNLIKEKQFVLEKSINW